MVERELAVPESAARSSMMTRRAMVYLPRSESQG
jgi:hypothetical protein